MKAKFIRESLLESNVVDTERLSSKVLAILNNQIKNELDSSQMYRAMACWMNDNKWPEGTKLFFKYADEELIHMSKIYQYVFDKNCQAVVPETEDYKADFKDVKDVVESALQHEIDVTEMWENISTLAREENDNTTYEFAQWFLKEQTEEEDKMRTILEKMELEMPAYEVDKLFGELAK